jgi:hypothetical protein
MGAKKNTTAGAAGSDTKGATPDGSHPKATDEDDVEGHNYGQNVMVSRSSQQSREHEIQRKLRQHELEAQSRRPHTKDSR